MKIPAKEAMKLAKANIYSKYGGDETSAQKRLLQVCVPEKKLNFNLSSSSKVFAIGSCFARNVEEALSQANVDVVSLNFDFPYQTESARKNGVINKYNPGVIKQAIVSAFCRNEDESSRLFKIGEKSYLDPLLKPGEKPVEFDLAIKGIAAQNKYFSQIKDCNTVFITLGMIEAWYDSELECYLNQPPHPKVLRAFPERYYFKRMSVTEVLDEMSEAITILESQGITQIVVTTSPVALNRTFTEKDVIVANCYSKSVLRVASEMLEEKFSSVTYFPSYETIIYGDRNVTFQNDLIHASDFAVSKIIQEFVKRSTGVVNENSVLDDSDNKVSDLYRLRKQVDKYKNLLIKHGVDF
tara:strand:+ start:5680 stop:6741 length:1062 start_codon:yes stop_codon:yes gene_type:complete